MIFFDHNSTTFLKKEVQELLNSFSNTPLNPSSIHSYGRKARGYLEQARLDLANSLGIELKRGEYKIIFTASGSEANNLIINNFCKRKILISSIEHPSIFEHLNYKKNITLIKVKEDGIIDLEDLHYLLKQVKGEQVLISVMMANNETGIIQPIEDIVNIAKEYGALVHTDAVQAFGKINLNIKRLGVDFVTISGHKIGAPVGVGALIAKDDYHILPHIIGGGQERGARAGTENVIGAMAFALASKSAINKLKENFIKVSSLRDYLEKELKLHTKAIIISEDKERLPNTSLIAMEGVIAQQQLINFDLMGIALSAGSACSSGKVKVSHVLRAMNLKDTLINSVIRVSLSEYNTKEEIDFFIKSWQKIYNNNYKNNLRVVNG